MELSCQNAGFATEFVAGDASCTWASAIFGLKNGLDRQKVGFDDSLEPAGVGIATVLVAGEANWTRATAIFGAAVGLATAFGRAR
jgi:hypothetical protein